MILNDLITEYQLLENNLKLAKDFYNISLSIMDFYDSEFSKVTQTYYTSSANSSGISSVSIMSSIWKFKQTIHRIIFYGWKAQLRKSRLV